jgi:uncharacterized protein YigA (DUF484 family)
MTPTPESVRARIQELTNERQALLNNVNAYNGAIQEAERLLAQLKQEPELTVVPDLVPDAAVVNSDP